VTLTLNRVEVILLRISSLGLPTNQIRSKSEKLFVDIQMDVSMDTPVFSKSIRSSPGNDLKCYFLTMEAHYQATYIIDAHYNTMYSWYSFVEFFVLKAVGVTSSEGFLLWKGCAATCVVPVTIAGVEMQMREPGVTVYAAFDYSAENADELTFTVGDQLTVMQCDDDIETEWWWCQLDEHKGYVPQNLIAVSSCFYMTKYHCSSHATASF